MNNDEVEQILKDNYHCVIACASATGEPWVAPVFFNYDAALRIVWESARDSRHAELIAENPRVASVVADLGHHGTPRGVYIEGQAREVSHDRLPAALDLFLNGPHPKHMQRDVTDYLGDKPFRLYELTPERLFHLTQVETPEGYVLDERRELPLPGRGGA
jgi:nitroimidazol reductase NimA-like FMN-containing flavoprotein (pyridoxamine 5'-phosphate oxidase superfamily)